MCFVSCFQRNVPCLPGAGEVAEESSEVSCNGHIAADQSSSQWRDQDQHNGNAQPSEEEARSGEWPRYPVCNGSAEVQELHSEAEESGAHGSGGTRRFLPPGLEEGELEQSSTQEQGEDGYSCGYTSEAHLRNGQSARADASGRKRCCAPAPHWLRRAGFRLTTGPVLYCLFISPRLCLCDRQTHSGIAAR